MTKNEARCYTNQLKNKLKHVALQYGLDETVGNYIIDNFITVLPEDVKQGMILFEENPRYHKKDNVRIDFKKSLIAGAEFAASISKPESVFNYIKLVVFAISFIEGSARQEMSSIEVSAVYLLHKKGAYDSGIEEEEFICEIQEWFQQNEGRSLERKEIVEAINHLYRIEAADFKKENIYLKKHISWKVK